MAIKPPNNSSIYLNNAASAWPRAGGVAEAVRDSLLMQPEHPGRGASWTADLVTNCRSRLARLLRVENPDRIVFTGGSTHALNLAILGLGLNHSSHVVTTVTEHNSVLRPLSHLREHLPGLRISIIGLDPRWEVDREAYESALQEGADLVVVNHASNVTGIVNDVGGLFSLARKAGAVTLLDASQSLGHVDVFPLELSADLVAITGHKGLRGPTGIGALYVSPEVELRQVIVGGTGTRSDVSLHPPEMPGRLEAGTHNLAGIAGLAAALEWLEEKSRDFLDRERTNNLLLHHGLSRIPNLTIYSGPEGAPRVPVTSFRFPGWSVEEAGYILSESFGIVSRTGLHCAPLIHQAIGAAPEGTIRFSPSGFTTEEEIGTALEAVRKLAS